MANIRTFDMSFVDDLFELGSGYVLNFSDRTMSSFFAEELNVDIDDEAYRERGTSKARRFRCYLNKVDLPTSVKTLRVLWRYREDMRRNNGREEWVPNAEGRFFSLLNKMQGVPDEVGAPEGPPMAAYDKPKILALKQRLIDLTALEPHPRGYALETWLRDAFNFYGLEAREAFRNKGEQIDGSFILQGETYLLEAKWQSAKTPAADLNGFQGKLDQKAAWARGLFVSISGFTDEGVVRVRARQEGNLHGRL